MMQPAAPLPILLLAAMLAAQSPDRPEKKDPLAVTTLAGAWQVALTVARTHKVPVLVFVLPPADLAADAAKAKAARQKLVQRFASQRKMGTEPELAAKTARDVFLLQLQGLRSTADEELHRILTWNVTVVADAKVCGALAGETIVLLGADGKRSHGFALDLLDEQAVQKALAPLLLDERVLAARRANLDPALRRDVDTFARLMQRQQQEYTPELQQQLQQVLERLQPLAAVVAPSLPPLPAAGGRGALGMTALDQLLGAELPLGLAVQQYVDPCTGCGMAFTPPRLATTLKLLAQ